MSAAAFRTGDYVLIREDYPPGHVRTPVYVRGKRWRIVRRLGEFGNPELIAYRLEGPPKALFAVRFAQADLWPDYAGPMGDTVDLDIYEHWLLPSGPAEDEHAGANS